MAKYTLPYLTKTKTTLRKIINHQAGLLLKGCLGGRQAFQMLFLEIL